MMDIQAHRVGLDLRVWMDESSLVKRATRASKVFRAVKVALVSKATEEKTAGWTQGAWLRDYLALRGSLVNLVCLVLRVALVPWARKETQGSQGDQDHLV